MHLITDANISNDLRYESSLFERIFIKNYLDSAGMAGYGLENLRVVDIEFIFKTLWLVEFHFDLAAVKFHGIFHYR